MGQKEKRKKADTETLSSARLSEAESVFIEGEKFFILEDYSKTRQNNERFGSFTIRKGYVKETIEGKDFHN